MTLQADEFIHRFLLHVLPNGFKHIRSYGLLASRCRATKLETCRRLLGVVASAAEIPNPTQDYRDHYQLLTGALVQTGGSDEKRCIPSYRITLTGPHSIQQAQWYL
jgi:hypothetical protein